MEKKKEELIGRLLGKYANEKNISVIKIGHDSIKVDTIDRLNRANATYRKRIRQLSEDKTKYRQAVRKREELENKNISLEKANKELGKQMENLNKQLSELNDELKLRIRDDGRFNILDL